jgi:two-component sensor histidine kinase
LGEAVEDMASAVEHRDQALRDALREQTVLLREVHHRVKNNLQIVGSLLSLQSARAKDPAIKEALQDAMVRIDAVSLSQRFMQQEEEEDRVCSVELFEAFAGLIRGRLGSGRRALVLSTQIEPGDLPLDTGSRLVSIAAEAVVCALRGSQSNPVLCHLIVSFSADKVEMALTVQNEPDAFANSPDQVCLDLIGGYVRQLKGRIMTGDGALSVSAPRGWPGPAQRHATDAQEKKFFRILDRTQGRLAS